MPIMKRFKTKYPGVYYIESTSIGSNKPERIYYLMYRKEGRLIEEKAGRQYQNRMTPARAAKLRAERIDGEQLTNTEKRMAERAAVIAQLGKWTIDRLWKEYKTQKPENKSINTDNYRYLKYLQDDYGKKEPHELIQLDIDRLRVKLLKKLKPQTVKHVLALLKRIISFGAKKQLCKPLVFNIEFPRVENCKTEDLPPELIASLLKAIGESADIEAANIMKMALYTGMRRGELFKLKWRDVDFERGFINIRDPKGRVNQKIPLNEPSREILKNHPRNKTDYVFLRSDGKPFTDIRRRVNAIKKAAGLPTEFRALHGLRHVYASILASSGQVDMYTLQKLLTHKSPMMTQRYAHLRDESLKKASNLAGDLIKRIQVNETVPEGIMNEN